MTEALAHRGPNDAGYFVNGRAGLGHRRLSIIDLSGGKQPIFNEDRSAAIIFNGEVYNYRDIGGHISGCRPCVQDPIRHGDDPSRLRRIRRRLRSTQFRGMFGFAIWDRVKRRLLLARDRLGVKPVYYYRNGRFLAFASEIKSLLEIASIPAGGGSRSPGHVPVAALRAGSSNHVQEHIPAATRTYHGSR